MNDHEQSEGMSGYDEQVLQEAEMLREADEAGGIKKVMTYLRLSGPGFLQSAITLGGGSLAGSLYLGVLAGTSMLWVQPLAMLLGIIMLSAIAYVTLSTGKRPFPAVNEYVNPVLGWGWAIAAFVANMVWVMPQYTLGIGVFQQNLMPEIFGDGGALGEFSSDLVLVLIFFVVAVAFTWNYGRGGWGVKVFELIIKVMVALIMISFIGVVVRLSMVGELEWGPILAGFVPDPAMILRPAEGFVAILENVPEEFRGHWEEIIVADQRGVIVSTAATAVGINMTFLFGYSLLKRGWGKSFRGFMKFDLGFGLLIPFLIATACVVIASSSQFHLEPHQGLMDPEEEAEIRQEIHPDAEPPDEELELEATGGQESEYENHLVGRALLAEDEEEAETIRAELSELEIEDPEAHEERVDALVAETTAYDRYLAATLVRRDNFDLANALEPFTGMIFAQYVFGIGVLGVAFSSITMLMIISAVGFCEFFGKPHEGWWFRIGALFPVTGVFAPFWWDAAGPWLVVPTSMFAFLLIPLAYISFFLLMNQKTLLGNEMPRGGRRIAWNALMGLALIIIVPASLYELHTQYGLQGLGVAALFVILVGIVHYLRPPRSVTEQADSNKPGSPPPSSE
ncbi:MAG: divalent metal cation transporter [Candidatus Hydrogenedentota bacterium]